MVDRDRLQAYTYESLSKTSMIRLVTILPGRLQDPINVRINQQQLDDSLNYAALSYTWGDPASTVPIFVHGEPESHNTRTFQVTQNLSMALRHLREIERRKAPRHPAEAAEIVIWIDALCINQTNDTEKSDQVSMMTSIFRKARQVKIWLGPAADDSDRAMEALKWEGQSNLIQHELVRYRRALEDITRRDFWKRVWVVQEILVGKDPVLVCGLAEADWKCSSDVIRRYLTERRDGHAWTDSRSTEQGAVAQPAVAQETATAGNSVAASATEATRSPGRNKPPSKVSKASKRTQEASTKPMDSIVNLQEQRKIFRAESDSSRTPTSGRTDRHDHPVNTRPKAGRSWLLGMLLNLRSFGATDRRDKIFSMLGLIDEDDFKSDEAKGRPELKPDYTLSFRAVSIRLVKSYLFGSKEEEEEEPAYQYQKSLNIICASQPDTRSDFPTWLPDFSKDNGMQYWPLQALGDDFLAEPTFSCDDLTLSVMAKKLAMIIEVTGIDDNCLATDDLSLLARLKCSVTLLRNYRYREYKSFWENLVLGDAVGRNEKVARSDSPKEVIDDFKQALRRCLEVERRQYRNELEGNKEENQMENPFLEFLLEFRYSSYRRRLAVIQGIRDRDESKSENVGLGMVPEDTKAGDEIYRLGECDHFVVLRRMIPGISCFQFVGPCYLSDISFHAEDATRIAIH